MESNFLSKEKICSRDSAISAQGLCRPRFNRLPSQAVPGDCRDKWVLTILLPANFSSISFFKIYTLLSR